MKRIIAVIFEMILATPLPALAVGFDNQSRFLFHCQEPFIELVDGHRFGLACWIINPNATNPKPRVLGLAGPLYQNKNEDTDRWAEFLGGTFLDANGEEPIFDFRYSEKSFRPFEYWLEVAYSPGPDKLLISPSVVLPTPISLFDSQIKVGGEADIFLIKGDVSRGFGPRVVFPLPIKGCSLAIAYQFHNERDILRFYLLMNFLPKK